MGDRGIQAPRALGHNRLAWYAGCDLVVGLNSLPLSVRLPMKPVPPALRDSVAKPGRTLPLSDFPRDLMEVWEVVKLLLSKGHDSACEEFNKRFGSFDCHLPLLVPKQPQHYARSLQKGAALMRPEDRSPTFFPPALSLWLVLWEPEAHPRLRRCRTCHDYFFARSHHQTVYCSTRCKRRQTVADCRRRSSHQ